MTYILDFSSIEELSDFISKQDDRVLIRIIPVTDEKTDGSDD